MTHTGTLSSNIAELYEVDHGKNINPKIYLRNLDVLHHYFNSAERAILRCNKIIFK